MVTEFRLPRPNAPSPRGRATPVPRPKLRNEPRIGFSDHWYCLFDNLLSSS